MSTNKKPSEAILVTLANESYKNYNERKDVEDWKLVSDIFI
jgi:hypothetical protein